MTAEAHTEYKVLLEDLQRRIVVLADGHAANDKNIRDTKVELQEQIRQVDHRLMVLDVNLNQKLKALDTKVEALDAKFTAKFDAIDKKFDAIDKRFDAIDARFDSLETHLARITMHLGIDGAPRPGKRLGPGTTKRRKR